ncbi:hypothetical protein ACFQV4_06690 [Streptomyces thermocarboxydus]
MFVLGAAAVWQVRRRA